MERFGAFPDDDGGPGSPLSPSGLGSGSRTITTELEDEQVPMR